MTPRITKGRAPLRTRALAAVSAIILLFAALACSSTSASRGEPIGSKNNGPHVDDGDAGDGGVRDAALGAAMDSSE